MRAVVVLALALIAIFAVAAAAFYWMRRRRVAPEGFKAAGGAAAGQMTAKERELFQNLQNNNFTSAQVDDMIQSGILNAKTVNKFLAALNVV